ncbi:MULTISPECIES: hypothetical protein [Rhizobium]|uniref:Intracellular septation protein A n=1 Tax=Rhizobium paranaense TaxID=1650438 RepID=A0A7W8XNA7_9HYPH|nr:MULTISPECIES: hypothetical protein [Rhizobium]MBB5572545.1 intracellular septation protein A [Rhizobium paranaense]PST63580.1 hypothetical protein C9E91_09520 [Rhizobium sp. SEMIA4064]
MITFFRRYAKASLSILWRVFQIVLIGGVIFNGAPDQIFQHFFGLTEFGIKLEPVLRATYFALIFLMLAFWRSLARTILFEKSSLFADEVWREIYLMLFAWALVLATLDAFLALYAPTEIWLGIVRSTPFLLLLIYIFLISFRYQGKLKPIADVHASPQDAELATYGSPMGIGGIAPSAKSGADLHDSGDG